MLVGVFLVLFLVLAITYMVLATTRPSLTNELTPRNGSIDKETRVGQPTDMREKFLVSSGSTFMVYLFCNVNNKTSSIGTNQEPINIFRVGNILRLQLLPGGVSSTPKTRLLVQTQSRPAFSEEEIELPSLPVQKWVHFTVVREGRKYTIYYNGKIVASQRTNYYPVVNSAQLTIGDRRLLGEFAFPRVAPVPYRQDEIVKDVASTSDTRYEPYIENKWNLIPNLFEGCPNGIWCYTTSTPPKTNPLKMWSTPYA